MAEKRKVVQSGRVTPKGTQPPTKGRPGGRNARRGAGPSAAEAETSTARSGRYTPPAPRPQKVSPRWVPIVMGALLVIGMLMIVLNYLNLLPGLDPSNWYLLAGLALITAGFVVATRWR
ncbi:MAG: hypothetical protein AVDCRST_MAG50-1388 [uncultured Acidimicrobiales bacterium]|uniref:Cell division protein CrgA n=1 Tax=uncultured Acidimicrobiales bacterium TaxID=310071 RepID=A0A6J4HYC5_9ACTN|nr:MAG: hypothetical protein AVDCRST_MAG50-1388 [uncultured Acidimicrobiales bacterium]